MGYRKTFSGFFTYLDPNPRNVNKTILSLFTYSVCDEKVKMNISEKGSVIPIVKLVNVYRRKL